MPGNAANPRQINRVIKFAFALRYHCILHPSQTTIPGNSLHILVAQSRSSTAPKNQVVIRHPEERVAMSASAHAAVAALARTTVVIQSRLLASAALTRAR
jgi:hypothetical protein